MVNNQSTDIAQKPHLSSCTWNTDLWVLHCHKETTMANLELHWTQVPLLLFEDEAPGSQHTAVPPSTEYVLDPVGDRLPNIPSLNLAKPRSGHLLTVQSDSVLEADAHIYAQPWWYNQDNSPNPSPAEVERFHIWEKNPFHTLILSLLLSFSAQQQL